MGLEKIVRRLNTTILLPAVVAGALLMSRPTYAESREKYFLSATPANTATYGEHHLALVPNLRLELLAQNVPTDEESRPGAYYINPNSSPPAPTEPAPLYLQPLPPTTNPINPNSLPAESAPFYLQPPNPTTNQINPTIVPTYLQRSNPTAEPSRNDENDYLGLGLVIAGGIGTLLGLLLITDDNYICSGYEGTSDYSCNTTNQFLIPEIVGTVSAAGITGLGIYMLLD